MGEELAILKKRQLWYGSKKIDANQNFEHEFFNMPVMQSVLHE